MNSKLSISRALPCSGFGSGILALLLILLLSGCITLRSGKDDLNEEHAEKLSALGTQIVEATQTLQETQTKLATAETALVETMENLQRREDSLTTRAQVSSQATQDILDRLDPLPGQDFALSAARQFVRTTLSVLGLPPLEQMLKVDYYFSAKPEDRQAGEKQIAELNREIGVLQRQIIELEQVRAKQQSSVDHLQGTVSERERQLGETSKALKEELNKQAWERIWGGLKLVFGWGGVIAAIIAAVVLFPALIPLFGSLISAIVGVFPSLIGWFRVTGKATLENVVVGVDRIKNEVRSDDPAKTYTQEEVMALFSRHLGDQTDQKDKTTIDYVRRTKNSKLASPVLRGVAKAKAPMGNTGATGR